MKMDHLPKLLKKKIKLAKLAHIAFIFLLTFLITFTLVQAVPPASPYQPGETLNPNCSPGDPNCTVFPPLFSSSTLTQGSILFSIGTTTVDQDNNNLYWDNTNKSLGIGTNTPSANLTVVGNSLIGKKIYHPGGFVIQEDPSDGDDEIRSITLDDSYLYVGGFDESPGPGNNQWRIEKRDKTTGALVSSFGSGGVITEDPSGSGDEIFSITIDDSYLYVGGVDRSPGPGNAQWRIEKRDKTTGALVSSFGSGGVITENPSSVNDLIWSITIDDSYLYVGGFYSSPGNAQWRIEKRDKTTGALVSSFGSGGVITEDPSGGSDEIFSITIDDSYLYVGGVDDSPGNIQWRIEKIDKTTGALVSSFGSGGVITENPGGADEIRSITIDDSYLYVGGVDYSPGNWQWRIEKRDKTTGALVSSFGSGGVITENPGGGYDEIRSITIDDSYLYVGGYDSSPGNAQWRIEKRDKTTGDLVSSFGSGGVITENPSGNNWIGSITLDDSYLYVGGYDSSPGNHQWRIEKIHKDTGSTSTPDYTYTSSKFLGDNILPRYLTSQSHPNPWAITTTSIYYTVGSVGIGTTNPGGGNGQFVLSLADSPATPTAVSNVTHIFSSGGEGYWMDATGNITLQTPHDSQTGEWVFLSENAQSGKKLRVEMEKLVKDLDRILGGGYVYENNQPYTTSNQPYTTSSHSFTEEINQGFNSIESFLKKAIAQIEKLFAKEIIVDNLAAQKIRTKELCLENDSNDEEVCLKQNELKALLEKINLDQNNLNLEDNNNQTSTTATTSENIDQTNDHSTSTTSTINQSETSTSSTNSSTSTNSTSTINQSETSTSSTNSSTSTNSTSTINQEFNTSTTSNIESNE